MPPPCSDYTIFRAIWGHFVNSSDYVTNLLMKAAASSDESVRKENYVAVQTYIHDQAVYIPVYYGSRDGAQLAETEGIIWANDGYPESTYVRVPA